MQRCDKYTNVKRLISAGMGLMIVLFVACSKDEVIPDKNSEEITFRFSAKLPDISQEMKTYAMAEDDENWLEDVDVLVFIADDDDSDNDMFSYRTVGRIISPSINSGIAQIEVDLWKTDLKTRIVVIANAHEQLNTYGIQPGELKRTLQNELVYEYEGEWKANLAGPPYEFDPLPMWGEYTAADGINDDFKSTGFGIVMQRSLARVDLTNTAATFELREVFVFNSKTSGLVIPSSSSFDGVKVTNVSLPTDLQNNDPILEYEVPLSPNSLLRTIYLFEAEAAEDRLTAPLDEEATALVVGGSYNSGPTTYYRIDFRNTSHVDKPPVPLLRNHLYEINISTVTQAGFTTPQQAFQSMPPVLPKDMSFGGKPLIMPNRLTSPSSSSSAMRTITRNDVAQDIGYSITVINENH